MITTVLFDLDGTLLPMDQDVFVKNYLSKLAVKMAPFGYEAELLFHAVWKGVDAMVRNDGKLLNEEVFWNEFVKIYGEEALKDKPVFEEFYRNEFQTVAADCGYTPKAKELIEKLKENGYRLVLATNPLFPAVATESRIRWAGLSPQDFEYYTTYENASYCKPNPLYYAEILEHIGVPAEECIMVGNDVDEDMVAKELGMQVFLLTDCLINRNKVDISTYPHGSLDEIGGFMKKIAQRATDIV